MWDVVIGMFGQCTTALIYASTGSEEHSGWLGSKVCFAFFGVLVPTAIAAPNQYMKQSSVVH